MACLYYFSISFCLPQSSPGLSLRLALLSVTISFIITLLLFYTFVNLNFCIYISAQPCVSYLLMVMIVFLSHFALSVKIFVSYFTLIFKILRTKRSIKNRISFKMLYIKLESSSWVQVSNYLSLTEFLMSPIYTTTPIRALFLSVVGWVCTLQPPTLAPFGLLACSDQKT